MAIGNFNIEPNRVLGTPDIIYLKEYPILQTTIITPIKKRNLKKEISKDESASLGPFYLEDTISVRSF